MKTVVALLALAVPIGLAFYLRLPEAVVREVKAAREERRKRRKR